MLESQTVGLSATCGSVGPPSLTLSRTTLVLDDAHHLLTEIAQLKNMISSIASEPAWWRERKGFSR
jgi:hypothetical protein